MKKVFSIITFLFYVALVQAQTPVFYESFNQCSGKTGWNGNLGENEPIFDNPGWSKTPEDPDGLVFAGNQCIRLGNTSSSKVTLKTPSINLKGSGFLIFKAGAWNTTSEKVNINIAIKGARIIPNQQIDEFGNIKLIRGKFTVYKMQFETIEDSEDNIQISFAAIAPKSNRFFLDEVEVYSTLPINISQLGYSTLATKLPYQLPEGITAYKVTENEDRSNIKIVALDRQIIPAETGVLLKGEKGSYNANFVVNGGSAITDNILQIQLTAGIVTPEPNNQIYVLNTGPNGPGFYWQVEGGTSANVGAGRCYLNINIPADQAAQGLNLDEGIISTISEMQSITKPTETYDLAGRRVQNLGRGLYIVNGKKVIR